MAEDRASIVLAELDKLGGSDPDEYARAKTAGKLNELPVNHGPKFAPVLHPTLETGVEALVAGALARLHK